MSERQTGGCPFAKHNQNNQLKSDDPLENVNEGNFGRAIELLEAEVSNGGNTTGNLELLGYAYRNTGKFEKAAENYQKALSKNPNHERAQSWQAHIEVNERAGGSGVGVLRPMTITKEALSKSPEDLYKDHPDNWVLTQEGDWREPNDYVPPLTMFDRLANRRHAFVTDLLKPIGFIVDRLVTQVPGDAGRWTRLPKCFNSILRLADLSHGRDWMATRGRNEDVKQGNLPGEAPAGLRRPQYAESGWTPDGSHNNSRWAYEGRTGASVPIHGLPAEYPRVDRSRDKNLPDPAMLARDFGYRDGNIIEAATASAHAWGHLQLLVHDVMQTAPDNAAKHATPTDPNSEEAAMGIKNVYYRSDAPNALHGKKGAPMNSVTGGWDMSPIYGSRIEELAKIRTNPNTGKPCPSGKIYLEGMDKNGHGGLYLPVETLEGGEQQIVTGFGRNMTMPLEAEHTLYARHHNWVCDVLNDRYPEWSDNQLFQIARRIITMTYVKIHTAPWTDALFAHEQVVVGLHANLYGRREWKKPVYQQLIFDRRGGTHPIADGLVSGAHQDFDVPENKGQSFAEAYRMGHQIVPDIHYFPDIGEKTKKDITRQVNLKELRELDGHRFIKDNGLGYCFHGLMNTRLGAPVAGNTADFFRRMETEEGVLDMFEAEIIKDRQRGMPPYNEYLKAHGLPPIEKWEDLFKDPESPESRSQIAKLKQHYPGGVDTLDAMLGLQLNDDRPDGFAITNPGFQTFVFEATSRIQKQELLTQKWRPNYVSWTAINLVQRINKEKMLYLHCPELREYLNNRENPNTFEYMGTNAKSNPEEHPLQSFLTYGPENLTDLGLGEPWKKNHFTGEDLCNYILRLRHIPTDKMYIVDLTDKMIYVDFDKDGRIHARDVLFEGPENLTMQTLYAAAQQIREDFDIPWPRSQSATHQEFESGWRLTQNEIRVLKQENFDEKGDGIPSRLTDLQIHTLVFNLFDDIESSKFTENIAAWKTLEAKKLRAWIQALGSTFRFGNIFNGRISLKTEKMNKRRPGKSTGIFDRNGWIDENKLATFCNELTDLASRSANQNIDKPTFLEYMEGKGALDKTTRAQWKSLFRLFVRMNGSETITVDLFRQFYHGSLLIKMFEFYAPKELLSKLRDSKPMSSSGKKSQPTGQP
jgi:hypothetical protein